MASRDKNLPISDTVITLFDNRSEELGGKLHIHKDIQILAGISGMLEVSIGSKKINLRVGDVIIIKAREPHSVRPVLPFTSTAAVKLAPSYAVVPQSANVSGDLAEALMAEQKSYVYMRREDE